MNLSKLSLEEEIVLLKERIAVAEVDGRNPIAIQAKFDTLFGLVEDLRQEIEKLKLNKIECEDNEKVEIKIDDIIDIEKPRRGRPVGYSPKK